MAFSNPTSSETESEWILGFLRNIPYKATPGNFGTPVLINLNTTSGVSRPFELLAPSYSEST